MTKLMDGLMAGQFGLAWLAVYLIALSAVAIGFVSPDAAGAVNVVRMAPAPSTCQLKQMFTETDMNPPGPGGADGIASDGTDCYGECDPATIECKKKSQNNPPPASNTTTWCECLGSSSAQCQLKEVDPDGPAAPTYTCEGTCPGTNPCNANRITSIYGDWIDIKDAGGNVIGRKRSITKLCVCP